ncbi:hypothetical protein RvY_10868 [Ramazzottius varieornatus]|uniref:HTH psq-type domain-containing protein n=1 Tax=Ramazzottius varieornatus TaxID=947166 RepID=A0A1D1VJM0_RAMVA|nr:hypothetical protein RvY_10868 [Ramazzottius varieornatus]
MAENCSPVTSATSEGYLPAPAPAPLRSIDKLRKRQCVQAHPGMEAAAAAVNDGMSIRMSDKRYRIPHTTLANKVNGKHGKKAGRPSTFTMQGEAEITEILVRCSKNGFLLAKRTLIKIVKAIAIAKGPRNRGRNIEAGEESATEYEDDSPTTQGYPCQVPPKRQRKTAKQVAAEMASDVTAPLRNIHFPANVPEGCPSKTRPKRATARAKTAPAPRKKQSAPASNTKAKLLPLTKTKPGVSAVKSKVKKT